MLNHVGSRVLRRPCVRMWEWIITVVLDCRSIIPIRRMCLFSAELSIRGLVLVSLSLKRLLVSGNLNVI